MEQKEEKLIISGTGLKQTLVGYLEANLIEEAKKMFVCRSDEAEKAINEYLPEKHEIMKRLDKVRVNKNPYETNKLPRAWQKVINETSVFFMFGNPVNFTLGNDAEESKKLSKYFLTFKDFMDDHYFNERMREAKRIAGSETESAKLYSYYTDPDTNKIKVRITVLANSKDHKLYTLFNKYGDMVAFAYGYFTRTLENDTEEHFDVYTNDKIYECSKSSKGEAWKNVSKSNDIGKIPVIYYQQETEWNGAQQRIERDEWVDSKEADTSEYFGDPYLLITRDIAGNRFADAEEVGKVVAVDGEKSRMEFIAPPDSSNIIANEKKILKNTIQQDTMSPDWTYESIMGLGTLSGEAMRRINLPGYVKRSVRSEVYNELIKREIHLVISILRNIIYVKDPDMRDGLERLRINFSYQDPFVGGIEDNSNEISTLMGCGAMSIRSGIEMNRNVSDKDAEEKRIWDEYERKLRIEQKLKAEASASQKSDNNGDNGGGDGDKDPDNKQDNDDKQE